MNSTFARTSIAAGLFVGVIAGVTWIPRTSGVAHAAPQPPAAPTFEVASIKPNTANDNRIMLGSQPGGRYVATNVTPLLLIRNSYQMQEFQIIGAPDWIRTEHFDVNAKAEGLTPPAAPPPPGTPSSMQLMMRALLADRFKLETHTETRELPIYNLVLVRSDGKPGPKLVPSTTDCAALSAARGRAGGPPPPAPPAPGERPQCGTLMSPGTIRSGAITITQLIGTLMGTVQRTIVDKTGLTGGYDVDLSYSMDVRDFPGAAPPPGAPPPPADPNSPSIFTALQEQLGLKLESARGPVPVLVIDRVEHPTPD